MGRLLFLVLIALLAFILWRWLAARFTGRGESRNLSTDLVKCQVCGTHVPKIEATPAAEGWRCSEHPPDGEH